MGNMTIRSGCVSGNQATNTGGGIHIETGGSTVLKGGVVISDNTANDGAGIEVKKGNLTVTKARIERNNAGTAGGGMWANSGTTVTFTDVNMAENTCGTNGGGLNSHGTLSLTNCYMAGCSAGNSGGGIYMDTGSTLTIGNTEITGCVAGSGGAGINFYAGSLILTGGKTRINGSTTNGKSSNVYFREFKPIQITGRLTTGSEIGVTAPANANGMNLTSGFGQNNPSAPADVFFSDNNEYKLNREAGVSEANLIASMKSASNSSYKITAKVAVTDDADAWDYAYFHIYGKSGRGTGGERFIGGSSDFKTYIDDDEGDSYTYEFNCGSDDFPTAVNFITSFGNAGIWRDFEGDVTVYINGVNVASRHVIHKVYGDEEKSTKIDIPGDKYPYPVDFEVDMPKEIDTSGVITVAAVDQYGVTWTAGGANATMENVSFPGEDTVEPLDNSGFKWKVSSTHEQLHHSTYQISFRSGSNVFPTITKSITVKFIFLLHLSVIVDGKEVFTASGRSKDTVQFGDLKAPRGYYILELVPDGFGFTDEEEVKNTETGETTTNYKFTFASDSVTLTAKLEPNNYRLSFEKNGGTIIKRGREKKNGDVSGTMSTSTHHYDEPFQLPENKLRREKYDFVGWNTQADGMGIMYKDKETVSNLTDKKGEAVVLYAIWKAQSASTTASIFSDGTALIYVGAGILLLSIAAAIVYSVIKKKKNARKE